jgi:hypothetical protein
LERNQDWNDKNDGKRYPGWMHMHTPPGFHHKISLVVNLKMQTACSDD